MYEVFALTIAALFCLALVRISVTSRIFDEQIELVHARVGEKILAGQVKSIKDIELAYAPIHQTEFGRVVMTPWLWTRRQVFGD